MPNPHEISELAAWVAEDMELDELIEYVTESLITYYEDNPKELEYEWKDYVDSMKEVQG